MNKFSLFLLILIQLYGCQKDESPPGGTTNINIKPELKSQEFKSGSYWIYKNDSTNKIDCTIVYQAFTDFESFYRGHGFTENYEYFEMFFNVYYVNNLSSSYWDRIFYDRVYQNPVNSFNQHLLGGPIIYYQDTLQVQDYFDSLQVGSNIFYQVQQESIDSTIWYSAKSFGVIKKVILYSINKGTWNLIRWKIVK